MNRISTFLLALFNKLTAPRATADLETEAKALISKIDGRSKLAYARAQALTEVAATVLIGAQNDRLYARRTASLAGRLEGALSGE